MKKVRFVEDKEKRNKNEGSAQQQPYLSYTNPKYQKKELKDYERSVTKTLVNAAFAKPRLPTAISGTPPETTTPPKQLSKPET